MWQCNTGLIVFFLPSFESMKSLCDRFNRAIDSIVQLTGWARRFQGNRKRPHSERGKESSKPSQMLKQRVVGSLRKPSDSTALFVGTAVGSIRQALRLHGYVCWQGCGVNTPSPPTPRLSLLARLWGQYAKPSNSTAMFVGTAVGSIRQALHLHGSVRWQGCEVSTSSPPTPRLCSLARL
uniref:(California timema) hypothetical protein n=1 Tax=Timema californicum TaxID=61474 RepID=A0A7R9J222_TIMCA|nr:unnamed protein product [Timema californicum]